eukprot:jgi/Botrbrau1/8559/Bobra.0359s0023.1
MLCLKTHRKKEPELQPEEVLEEPLPVYITAHWQEEDWTSRQWKGDQCIRIWTPPGGDYGAWGVWVERAPSPNLHLLTAMQAGCGATLAGGRTCAHLITSGQLPTFVVVGIDHAGSLRSWDYNPYPPGTGPGEVRKDAKDLPGGGVDDYLQAIVQEIVPYVARQYACSTIPERMAFGGSSFGGICMLRVAQTMPHVFGALLIESPSLWIAEEAFLEELLLHEGAWPQACPLLVIERLNRIFL